MSVSSKEHTQFHSLPEGFVPKTCVTHTSEMTPAQSVLGLTENTLAGFVVVKFCLGQLMLSSY